MVIVDRGPARARAARLLPRLPALLEAGEGFTEAVVVDPERLGGAAARPGTGSSFDADGRLVAALAAAGQPRRGSPSGSCRWPTGPRPAVRGGRRLPADPAAGPAGDRGRGARRAGGRRAWPPRPISTSGSSTTASQYANAERFPTAQRIVVGPDRGGPPGARGHAADLRPDRHPGPRPRPGGALPPGPDRRALRRPDRQPPQDQADLREPARAGIADADLARVAAPVGLDIGSQTVPEIAISIVAELIARRNLGPERARAAPVRPPRPSPEPAAVRRARAR